MVKIEAGKRQMVISLDYDPSRQLAHMVLQAVWLYAATTDEDRAFVRQMADMLAGRLPLSDMDITTITSPDELVRLRNPLEVKK